MVKAKNQGIKPNPTWTHVYLKAYVKALGLNHPKVKMSMNKTDMIAGLKAAKHWGPRAPSFPASKMTAKGGPLSKQMRPPAPPRARSPKSAARRARSKAAVAQANSESAANARGRVTQAQANQARANLRGMLG